MNKKTTIIIPSWFEKNQGGRHHQSCETYYIASKCLERMLECVDKKETEIILIDNGSTLTNKDIPNDLMRIEDYWKSADKIIKNSENMGFGFAVNQGIEVADGDFIIQSNNDIIVFDGFIDALIEVFNHKELNPPVGVSMLNLIKNEYQKNILGDDGKVNFEKLLQLKKEDLNLPRKDQYEAGSEFGSLWCIKKSLAKELIKKDGFFFDPQFLIGMSEDRDLWKRVRLLGFQTFRSNKMRIGHVGNITISKVFNHKQYTTENRKKLKEKWKIDN